MRCPVTSMTQAQSKTVSGIYGWAKEVIQVGGGLLVLLGAIYTIVVWGTGGLKLQSQIDLEQVRSQLSSIQAAQTDQALRAQQAQDRIIARLDALPRPADYAQQDAHLSRLDAAIGELRDATVGLRHDVDNLMRLPAVRQPR